MDEEYAKPRDVDSDLAEITSRLGEPQASHRTNGTAVFWRFALGVFIVIAATVLHFGIWTGEIPWPKGLRAWKLWLLILAGMFIGPGLGLYLIMFAVRGMKLFVLLYPNGLFIWHRGQVTAFPWEDISAIQYAGIPDKAVLHQEHREDGMPEDVWFDLSKSRRRVFGTTLTLTRADGEQAILSSTLDDFADLGQRVQKESFQRLFPLMWDRFLQGQTLGFGTIVCDSRGLTIGTKTLNWSELDSLERVSDKLEIKTNKKKKAWAKCDLAELVNLHVLVGIVAAAKSMGGRKHLPGID